MVSSAHASLYGSRLIRLLRGLADDAPDPTLQNFAISFGRLADLSGSMTLLNAHEAIDDLDHGPTEIERLECKSRIHEGEGGTYSLGRHEFCTTAGPHPGPHGQATDS